MRDRSDGDDVPMTQESLSYMPGMCRAGASVVAAAPQVQGLIQQSRGCLAILNRAGLAKEACIRHRLMKDGRRRIIGGSG